MEIRALDVNTVRRIGGVEHRGLRAVAVGAAVAALLVTAACGGSGSSADEGGSKTAEINTIVSPTQATAPLQVAMAKGFFADEGVSLKVAPTTPTSQTIQLLIGGKLDIALASPGAALNNAIAGGGDLVMIASAANVPSDPAKANSGLLVSDKLWKQGVTSIKDLKGKTINILPTLQSASGMAVVKLLQKNGLDLGDVKTQDWADPLKLSQAFQNGAADVVWQLEPFLGMLRAKNGAHLLGTASDVSPGSSALVVVANKKWAEDNKDTVVAFLKAYLQGVDYFNAGADSGWSKNADVLDVVAKNSGGDAAALTKIPFPEFSSEADIDVADVKATMDFLQGIDAVKKVIDPASYTDPSYLDAARGDTK